MFVNHLYKNASNRLQFADRRSNSVLSSKVVRKGDPVFPLFFNTGIDILLKPLPQRAGIPLNDRLVNAADFPDNLLLFSETHEGHEHLFNQTYEIFLLLADK